MQSIMIYSLINMLNKKFNIAFTYLTVILINRFKGCKWHKNNTKFVFFDLKDPRVGPYYFALIFHFYSYGYNILINNRIKFIGNCQKVDKYLFFLSRVKIGFRPSKKEKYIYIFDKYVSPIKGNWAKNIMVDPNVYYNIRAGNLIMPFSLNPFFYYNKKYLETRELRNVNSRKIRIVFSGNQNTESYDQQIIQNFFNKLSRIKIFEILNNNLDHKHFKVISKRKNLDSILSHSNYKNKLIWLQWSWSPSRSENLDLRISNDQWLKFLSDSDFFLATPGVRMPLCFNVIEAISVGTIPVLEFPEYFTPPLEDRINCIVFSGQEDLIHKIYEVLSFNQDFIDYLRNNLIQYYEEHLKPGVLCQKIESNPNKSFRVYFHATTASYSDYINELS